MTCPHDAARRIECDRKGCWEKRCFPWGDLQRAKVVKSALCTLCPGGIATHFLAFAAFAAIGKETAGGKPMKVNVQVDCTPEEARKFLGLPDVQPFQQEMMKILREKSLENLKMMEPEVAMKTWMPLMNQ